MMRLHLVIPSPRLEVEMIPHKKGV